MDSIIVSGEVLDCKSGVAKRSGKPYNIILVRFGSGDDTVVGKIFSDVAVPSGTKAKFNVAFGSNQDLFLTPRIVSLAK